MGRMKAVGLATSLGFAATAVIGAGALSVAVVAPAQAAPNCGAYSFCLYQDWNFGGSQLSVPYRTKWADLRTYHFNDSTSSLATGSLVWGYLYQDINYKGATLTVPPASTITWLRGIPNGSWNPLANNWNDSASSVKNSCI